MFEIYYQKFCFKLSSKFPRLYGLAFPYRKILKFVISGGLAAVATLGTLYFFTDLLGLWYIFSSIIAFLAGFFVSFTFQKFWTFRDNRKDILKRQMILYFIIAIVNLLLNTLLLYIFVDYIHVHYIISQIIVSLLIACASFFVYRNFVFNQ